MIRRPVGSVTEAVVVMVPLGADGTVVAVMMAGLVAMTIAVAMVMMVLPVVMVMVSRAVLVPLRRGGAGDQDEGGDDETCETWLHGSDLPVRG